MKDARHAKKLISTNSLKIAETERQVREQLTGRVKNFRLLEQERGLILRGHASSYHAKQLAQHAVMQTISLPILTNDIEVV